MAGLITNAGALRRESFDNPAHGDCTWFTLFSADRTATDSLCGGVAELAPGGTGLALHRHTEAEIYYILSGSGLVTIDGTQARVGAGDAVFIPGDAEHGIVSIGGETLRFFYVFPTGSFADVVYRFSAGDAGAHSS